MEQVKTKIKPNFLIIGAAKSGTTALYAFLKEHPDVFMPEIKEPNYFTLKQPDYKFKHDTIQESYRNQFVYNYEDYISLFSEAAGYQAVGEASPIYLFDKNTPNSIYECLPSVKIIVILRNPAERAFSNFIQAVRANLETTDNFQEALELESKRTKENWWWSFQYKKAGFYYEQLKRYYSLFPENQIKVFLYEDWKNSPKKTYKEILKFLNISDSYEPNFNEKHKTSYLIQNTKLDTFIKKNNLLNKTVKFFLPKKLRRLLKKKITEINSYKPIIDNSLKRKLLADYKEDIRKLEKLIDRDLNHWYK